MIDRLRSVRSSAETLALAGVGLTAAGLAVAADALAETAVPDALTGIDRITFGLWRLQLAQTLTLTVGLGLLTLGLDRGARLGEWREPAARAGAGIAIGALLVAAAVVLASTLVALQGHVADTPVAGHSRLFVWLRQAVTAVGFGGVWVLIAARLSHVVALEVEPEELEHEIPEPASAPVVPEAVAAPVAVAAPSAPATTAPVGTAAPARPVLPADISSPAARARDIYAQRLSFSPRAADARAVVDEVVKLDAAGKHREADQLVRKLEQM